MKDVFLLFFFILFIIVSYLAIFYFNVTKNRIGEEEPVFKKFIKMQIKTTNVFGIVFIVVLFILFFIFDTK